MIYTQIRSGHMVDLLHPRVADINFVEIADALAKLNRYAGNSTSPISVAQHTLIACDAATTPMKPYVLLHDAHEAFIGDITRPAWAAIEWEFEKDYEDATPLRLALGRVKDRLDRAIHAKAGLAEPTPATMIAIAQADLTALVTERRDFLCHSDMPWAAEVEAASPLAKVYRPMEWTDAADALAERFRQFLPCFQTVPHPDR